MVALAVAIVTTCGRAADKRPIPIEAAQQKALELVREVYGEQWGNAETLEEKRAMADKLMQQAAASTDPTNRYVLLEFTCDIACEAGDVETAFRAIEETARQFDIDHYRAKGTAVSQAAKGAKSREQHQEIAEASLALIDEAVDGDDFPAARYLAKLAVEAARKARHGALVKQAVARSEAVEKIARAYDRDRIKEHQATLIIDPVNPDANAAVGKYLCFVKGKWEKGVLNLALGNDMTLRELARKEIADEPDSLAVGDGWWDLSENAAGLAKRQLENRAAYWYRKALPGLTALVRGKVERRLDECQKDTAKTVREHYLSPRMIGNVQFLDFKGRTWKNDIRSQFEIRKLKNGYGLACSIRDGYKHKLVLFPTIDVASHEMVASFTVGRGNCVVGFRPSDLSPKGAGVDTSFKPGQEYHIELWYENGIGKCRVNGESVAVRQHRGCYGFFGLLPSQQVSMVFHELYFVKRDK